MPQSLAYPLVGSAAMRGAGVTIRTSQTLGLEWLDLGKQNYDDLTTTLEQVAASPTPADALAAQAAFAQRATDRFVARSAVFGDLVTTLFGSLLRITPGPQAPIGQRREP